MLTLVVLWLFPVGWRIYFVSYWDGWLFWGYPYFQGNKEDEGWCWFWYGLCGWRFFYWSFLYGYMVKSVSFYIWFCCVSVCLVIDFNWRMLVDCSYCAFIAGIGSICWDRLVCWLSSWCSWWLCWGCWSCWHFLW